MNGVHGAIKTKKHVNAVPIVIGKKNLKKNGRCSMNDANTLRRRQWLRQLSRRYKTKNAKDIDKEELTWRISERLALIICGTLVVGAIMEILK